MIQIFPDDGLLTLLHDGIPDPLYYFLYTNNVSPVQSSIVSGFTVNAGTAYVSVAKAAFTLSSLAGGIARYTAPDIALTNSSGVSLAVYGYIATTGASDSHTPNGHIIIGAAFDGGPITIPDGGTQVVTPTLALKGAC